MLSCSEVRDGAPLTLELTPRMWPLASWLRFVFMLTLQVALLLICTWLAVHQATRPLSRSVRAIGGKLQLSNRPGGGLIARLSLS